VYYVLAGSKFGKYSSIELASLPQMGFIAPSPLSTYKE
jgi:hypothetical protein